MDDGKDGSPDEDYSYNTLLVDAGMRLASLLTRATSTNVGEGDGADAERDGRAVVVVVVRYR